jgi:diaminohydroxyphosphoribosylaminopyrimidine deaminase/5-amino-6-(5-phosphoribosylamino)uracil reductase
MDPYLLRCLELALRGQSAVEPNPRVGAVVVHQGKIIGEGWHQRFGGPHAEVNAIAAVEDKSLLRDSTLYVSLEPCNHHGKTPPCTSLILEHGIPRVIVGALDVNPQMAGKSVALLRERGVEVVVQEDSTAFEQLNAHFIFNQRHRLPWVTLKWAESADGFIAGLNKDGKPTATAISGKEAQVWVHQLRAEHQAILVGFQTALIDDPSLTTRLVAGPNPVRIVWDAHLELPRSAKVFADNAKVLVLTEQVEKAEGHISWVSTADCSSLRAVMAKLHQQHRIGSILVEGGAFTLKGFLQGGCWNEAYRVSSAKLLTKGVKGPTVLPQGPGVPLPMLGSDAVMHWRQSEWGQMPPTLAEGA